MAQIIAYAMPVAAGGIEQGAIWVSTAALAFDNHVQAGAVFYGAARVKELGFAVDFNAGEFGIQLGEPEQRSIHYLVQQK
jgi:hypothetical protein